MVDKIQGDKSPAEELRRIAVGQLDGMEAQLNVMDSDSQTAIHELRKHIKRTRALLRLLREPLGKRHFKSENRRFRDLARMFAQQRDADALVETYDRLVPQLQVDFSSQVVADTRTCLLARTGRVAGQDISLERKQDQARQVITDARKAISHFPRTLSHKQLNQLFLNTYSQAKQAFGQVVSDAAPEVFHDWRKLVKDLLYQGKLIQNCGTGLPRIYRAELEQLAEKLGEHHDICELLLVLKLESDLLSTGMDTGRFEVIAEKHREELEHQTKLMGLQLFADKPKKFARHYLTLEVEE